MLELLILVASVLISISTGLFVIMQNPTHRLNQVYGVVAFSFMTIAVANYFTLELSSYALFAIRLVIFATTVLSVSLYFLVLLMRSNLPTSLNKGRNGLILLLSIIIACLDFSPLVFTGLDPEALKPSPIPGPAAVLFMLHFVGFTSLSFGLLIKESRKARAEVRTQMQFVLAGMLPILVLAPITSFILPVVFDQLEYIALTPLYVVFFVLLVAYAIVRHRLFDVRLAAIRTVVYVLAVASLAAIYYLLAYIVSTLLFQGETTTSLGVSPINIFLALILAFLFQPLKHFFDRATNRIFYRDSYNNEEFFARLSELLASTTDLRGLLERASREIASTMKAEQGSFFIYYNSSENHYITAGTKRYARMPMYDARLLDKFTVSNKAEIFVTKLFDEKDEEVRRLLVSHNVAIFMPLRYKKGVIGYLFLGDRLTSSYSQRDLKVLTTIADNLIIAIQNALSVHEVREINASLQQRIEAATAELRESNIELHRLDMAKDEFVSMASHQLRTPLTSIKGYVSMMLDGDVGRITGAQKDALEEAYNSSERMVRLIGDFLSVSRLQTGKFMVEKKPSNLVDVVKQEVSGLRMIASTHGQKIAFRPPKSLPIIVVDESKLRQVMMNFMDNAVYYSKTNSTITVTLAQEDEDIIFTVVDTGIGVPLEEQKKLFRKFFRAGNARQQRPDGTGVGLFLAKRIVAEHHGKIIFKSVEGEGSTFGFRIPLDQKTDDTDDDKKNSK